VVGLIKDKKVPKREAASRYWADNYDPYDVFWHDRGPLYQENFRDFISLKAREQATKNKEYLESSPSEIIETVMRRGSLSLGRQVKIIKCPGTSNPGVCLICPITFNGDERMVCSGPTVQKTKGGLIRAEKTYYDEEDPCCSAYDMMRLENSNQDYLDLIAYVHQELHDHPDYEVVTYEDMIDDPDRLEEFEQELEQYR